VQTLYFVKWQIRMLQIHRLERMMMLQENSRLADLRLVAFFFDNWVIGQYNSVIETSISWLHAALRAGVRLVHKVAGHRLNRKMFQFWMSSISRADACAHDWANLALLIEKGSSISAAIAREAGMVLLKARHASQTFDDSLQDAKCRIM